MAHVRTTLGLAWGMVAALFLAACGGGAEAAEVREPSPADSLSFPPLGRRPAIAPTDGDRGLAPSPGAPRGRRAREPERGELALPVRAPETSVPKRSVERADSQLNRSELERIVARGVTAANKASKGKVHGNNSVVAVACLDLKSGSWLCSRLANTPMVPASNLKVVTAASALLGLGLDAEFETTFEAVGVVEAGALRGDLVVRAGADPLHRREGSGDLSPWLDPLARDLARAGIQRIQGQIVLDHGPFQALGTGPEWPNAKEHWLQYCGLASGFSANGGSFRVTVSSDQKAARVTLRPRHHGLKRRGSVSVGGKRNDLRIGANPAGVTVGGKIPPGFGPHQSEFRHPDPDQLFARSILEGLAARGISADGVVMPAEASASRGRRGATVHVMRSRVTSILEAILGDSNNPVTDQLFCLIGGRLGGNGSRPACAAAIRSVLAARGIDVTGLEQVDGSGLSRANRLSAATLAETHRAVCIAPTLRGPYLDALLIAGSEGKLARRMRGTEAEGRVAAKTGWIGGASSLSGLVLSPKGTPRYAFAVIVSYPNVSGLNRKAWKPMQDELCALFVRHLDTQGALR